MPKFCFERAEEQEDALELVYVDQAKLLTYRAQFKIDQHSHMIVAKTVLEASRPVHLHWLAAPVMPASQHASEMIDFAGRWCDEFQMNRTAWSAGVRYRENRTGRTGHEHFPG